MSITFSNCDTNERNNELDVDIDDLRIKVETLTRENEMLSSEIKFKENEFNRKMEEEDLDNQMLRKTIENLEELTKKLKEWQVYPENSRERVLHEIKLKFIETENKLIISQNSETRLKIQIDQLIEENNQLKKQTQSHIFKNISNAKNLILADEEIELENVEELKDIILELSNEYEELKLKYNDNLDAFYEKEIIIMELKEKHNTQEDDFLRKIFENEAEITRLNERLDECERELISVKFDLLLEN